MNLIVLDTETTGLDPATCGVVEFAAVVIQEGRIAGGFRHYVWPGYDRICRPKHWDVLRVVSGISPARLLDAPELAEVLRLFTGAMEQRFGLAAPFPVTSYNVPFDRSFLEAARPAFPPGYLMWQPCLMARCRQRLRAEAGYYGTYGPSLSRACEWLGLSGRGDHRALGDAWRAAEIAIALERSAL
jgi:DNA polymerase III epsilon subunit-like protein